MENRTIKYSLTYFRVPLLIFLARSLNHDVLPLPLPVLPIKHGSLKEKWQWWPGNTKDSLAAVNGYCHWAIR